MEHTPYTKPLHFECCRQCIDPDSCLGRRKQWLEEQLAALTCVICGATKPDDGSSYCSAGCYLSDAPNVCSVCGKKEVVVVEHRGLEGDDVYYTYTCGCEA